LLEVSAAGFALMVGDFSGFASERWIVSTASSRCHVYGSVSAEARCGDQVSTGPLVPDSVRAPLHVLQKKKRSQAEACERPAYTS
jgi:hypothetical protein